MDTFQPLQAFVPERPLLGVWVLMTCLAGGAATQNLAVVPHAVDQVDYRFGPAPRLPEPRLETPGQPVAMVAPPAFRQFRSADRAKPLSDPELALIAPDSAGAGRDLPVVTGSVQPAAATLAAAARPVAVSSVVAPAAVVDAVAAAPVAEPALVAPRAAEIFDAAFAGIGTPPVEAIAPAAPSPEEPAAPALANPPELRGFDLARVIPSAARKPAPLIAPRVKPQPASAAPRQSTAGRRDRLLDATVYHPTTIMIGGQSAGQVDVRIGADMKPSIKVADLLAMVSAQMDPELSTHLSAASAASDYVSFAALRDAGFKVSYNAGADSVSIDVAD